MAVFSGSGFSESHEPPPCVIEIATKVCTYYIFVLFAVTLAGPPGRYGASSRPMTASSGFLSSPGHAALGDAASCTTSTLLHGH
jgi:hypothetical protein